jgi:hypothetical protein
MKETIHTIPEFTLINALVAIAVGIVIIALMSLVKEPNRRTINAIIIAGAGGVYWSGGLGVAEFPFGIVMFYLSFKGLSNYKYIALGWVCHTVWDVVHHLYGNPIIPFDASSSAACAVCDLVLATWFFFGAPNIFGLLSYSKISQKEKNTAWDKASK